MKGFKLFPMGGLFLLFFFESLFSQNFQFPITVSDQNGASTVLIIGMNATGTGSIFSPPPPPSGAFDARLRFSGDDYTKLIMVSSMSEKTINVRYQPGSGGAPIVLSWNSSMVGQPGVLVIKDAFGGSFFSLDMSSASSLNTASNPLLGEQLNIVLNATEDLPLPVELMRFMAMSGDQKIILEWSTASELANLGFEVYRALSENGEYQMIDSYENNDDLEGGGYSNNQRDYSYTDEFVTNNITYWYKIADVDYNGIRTYHGPVSAVPASQTADFPEQFTLHQNYPNPFNPETIIKIELLDLKTNASKVELNIHNCLGIKIRTLYNAALAEGIYEVVWDGKNDQGVALSSGVYFVHLKVGYSSQIQKMQLVR